MTKIGNKISVCGIGPGHPDYILPAVFKRVEEADILIGGQRHLEIFSTSKAPKLIFNGKLEELKENIEKNAKMHRVILVSGDTGFHSLRRFLLSNILNEEFEFIPGISSFQYLYAKLGLGYENAFKASLHGTETAFLDKIKEHDSIFLLTDKKNNWKSTAQQLTNNGFGHLKYHIGFNLSYPNEKIISTTASEALKLELEDGLCAVIIENIQ